MIVLIIYLAICILVGMMAKGCGRSFIVWFSLSIIVDPILALIIFYIIAKDR